MSGQRLLIGLDQRTTKAVEQLGLIEPTLERILRYAVADTVRWGRAEAVRRWSALSNIPASVIRARVADRIQTGNKGIVWLGMNRVALGRIADPVQTLPGATVRGTLYPKTFRAKLSFAKRAGVYLRQGRARFPIVAQYQELEPTGAETLRLLRNDVAQRLRDTYLEKARQFAAAGDVDL